MTDRGRDVSSELTEVRTVLSRAENARRTLWRYQAGELSYGGRYDFSVQPARYVPYVRAEAQDPDLQEMIDALDDVIYRPERWRRTGRTKKE
jgi:hypothetical protein